MASDLPALDDTTTVSTKRDSSDGPSDAAGIFYGLIPTEEKVRRLKQLLPSREAEGYLRSLAKAEAMRSEPGGPQAPVRSRFQNCFYYFRGPSKGSTEAVLDKQLEDNATKALVNVLEYSEREVLWRFTKQLAGRELELSGKPSFYLQGGPEAAATDKLLLGISLEGRIDPDSWGLEASGSRVDGAIHLPGELTLLIETKVVPALDGSQLNRHAKEWGLASARSDGDGTSEPPAEWVLASWADIHAWCRRELEVSSVEPTRFLLGQLAEFLELAGLAPTWVLRREHFDYLELPPEGRDPIVQAEIKTRLRSLWATVEERLGEERFRDSFGEVRVGNLGDTDDHAWAQTHFDEGVGPVNLTIELWPGELTLNLVGWFKDQGIQLEAWLRSAAGQQFIRDHPEYELVVFVVRGKAGKGGKVVWQGAKGEEVARLAGPQLESDALARELMELRQDLDPKTERLGFHLRRAWPVGWATDREDLAEALSGEIEMVDPILQQIRDKKGAQ